MQFSQANLPKDGFSQVAVTSQRVRILCHTFSLSFFKFQQEQLTGIHDVNVLSFIRNYM